MHAQRVIGASLSEPHTSELAGGMSINIRPVVRHFIIIMDYLNGFVAMCLWH